MKVTDLKRFWPCRFFLSLVKTNGYCYFLSDHLLGASVLGLER